MRSTGSRQRVDPPPTRAARCACKAGGGGVGCLWSSSAYLLLTPVSPLQLLEVNKQWDQHFRSMKQQYEQKVL